MCCFQSSSPAQIALQTWVGYSSRIQLVWNRFLKSTLNFFQYHYLPGWVSKCPDTAILKNSAKLKSALSSFKLNVMVVSVPIWRASNSDGSYASSVLTAFFIASEKKSMKKADKFKYNFCTPPASVKFLSHARYSGVTVTVISSFGSSAEYGSNLSSVTTAFFVFFCSSKPENSYPR